METMNVIVPGNEGTQNKMIAINTHWKEASGATYFTKREGKDKSIRVDHILIKALTIIWSGKSKH